MGRIQTYLRPRTLDEAVELLKEHRGKAAVLAGGTSLSVRMPGGIDSLVDIRRLGLEGIEVRDRKLCIKTCTTVADLAASTEAQTLFGGVLATACKRIASTPLRNLITVGGNAFHVLPWSDLPALFLATQAEFVFVGEGTRVIAADTLYGASPKSQVKPWEILVEVRIPLPASGTGASFHKVSRTQFDYATMDVAVVGHQANGVIADCRIVLGCLRTLPLRATSAEQEVRGKAPSAQLFAAAAARAAGAIEPAHDFRFSPDYRRHLTKVWVKRALLETFGVA